MMKIVEKYPEKFKDVPPLAHAHSKNQYNNQSQHVIRNSLMSRLSHYIKTATTNYNGYTNFLVILGDSKADPSVQGIYCEYLMVNFEITQTWNTSHGAPYHLK